MSNTDTDDLIRLQNAQEAIRSEYFDNEHGLYTLNCVPGAGKSVVVHHIAAEEILRRYVHGDPTPEQHVAVVSFNRREASSIVPAIIARIREIVEHDLVPIATQVSDRDVEHLAQRINQAPYIGTIDSLLRDVLNEFATDVGFAEMPDVGNTARMQQVHDECYQTVADDDKLSTRLSRLDAAYPAAEYEDGVRDMLETAVTHCRDRRIATDKFRSALEQTVEDAYANGQPDSFGDIMSAISRCIGSRVDEASFDELSDVERDAITEMDAQLYQDWIARIDDFCIVLDTYRDTYRQVIRDHGAVTHTDVAYLVDAYFDGRLDVSDEALRTRIKQRKLTRVQSLLIDEAQDVSSIQHAALSHLVTSDSRVFAAGDKLQSIYRWRDADPMSFETATADGEYLGIDWSPHAHRTATTTYRCTPDIATAINEIAEPMLTDSERGNLGELDITYPGLDADRDPSKDTCVHVAACNPPSRDPDSYTWINDGSGRSEAQKLALLLSKGLADGTFTDDDGDHLGITVLFRWTSKMDAYEDAFDDQGLTVQNASENLFDSDVVGTVLDICEWLVSPADSGRTRDLITDSALGRASLKTVFEDDDQWDIRSVLAEPERDLTDTQEYLLDGLADLRARRERFLSRPAARYIEDIIETLALRADPYDIFDDDPSQRVANLDALIETITDWEADDQLPPRDLIDLLDPFRDSPYLGPNQPSTADTEADVEFRTIHDAKGDEDDIVVVANPGFDLSKYGPQSERFLTQGGIAGLAPPPTRVDANGDETDSDNGGNDIDAAQLTNTSLGPFTGGLYGPDGGDYRDSGLRWGTNNWCDNIADTGDTGMIVGPQRLRDVIANERAEAWRLLYVALTRAKDHLVIPLPEELPGDKRPRDRWLDTLYDTLDVDVQTSGTHSIETHAATNRGSFEIGINDVKLDPTRSQAIPSNDAEVAVTPPRRSDLDQWAPRFVSPSTIYPLSDEPDKYVLDHLLNNALHTETNDVPDDVPLQFETLGPDDVGTHLHEVLTTLIDRDVSEQSLRSPSDDVRDIFDEILEATQIDADERDSLYAFFTNSILDDFLDSDLWELICNAEHLTVEKPIDGLVTVNDVEFEIHGTPDILVELPSGKQYIVDLKITLTELTADTRRRYETQVGWYAYLLRHQGQSTGEVRQLIAQFGTKCNTIETNVAPSLLRKMLAKFLE